MSYVEVDVVQQLQAHIAQLEAQAGSRTLPSVAPVVDLEPRPHGPGRSVLFSPSALGGTVDRRIAALVTTCGPAPQRLRLPRCLRRIGGGGIQGAPHEHRSSSSTAGFADEADCRPHAEAPSCGQGPCFSRPGQRKRQLAKRRQRLCGSRSFCEDHGRCDPDRPSDGHQCFQRLGAASGSGELV